MENDDNDPLITSDDSINIEINPTSNLNIQIPSPPSLSSVRELYRNLLSLNSREYALSRTRERTRARILRRILYRQDRRRSSLNSPAYYSPMVGLVNDYLTTLRNSPDITLYDSNAFIPPSEDDVIQNSLYNDNALTKDESRKIATIPISENTEGDCSICRDKLDSEVVGIANCEHLFHHDCIVNWGKYKAECPNCRKTIPIIGVKRAIIEIDSDTDSDNDEIVITISS